MYTCIHVCMYTCIHVYMYTCIHVYMYTYIHIYIYSVCGCCKQQHAVAHGRCGFASLSAIISSQLTESKNSKMTRLRLLGRIRKYKKTIVSCRCVFQESQRLYEVSCSHLCSARTRLRAPCLGMLPSSVFLGVAPTAEGRRSAPPPAAPHAMPGLGDESL